MPFISTVFDCVIQKISQSMSLLLLVSIIRYSCFTVKDNQFRRKEDIASLGLNEDFPLLIVTIKGHYIDEELNKMSPEFSVDEISLE